MSLSDKKIIVGGEEVPVYPEEDVKEFIEKKVIDKIEKLREKYANELQKDWIDLIEEIKKEAGPKLVEKK